MNGYTAAFCFFLFLVAQHYATQEHVECFMGIQAACDILAERYAR